MDNTGEELLFFFREQPKALPLYKAFEERLMALFPETLIRVQKTQISFSLRHVYACVSFLKVRKKAEMPENYIVVTLGLPYPLESSRAAAKVQPYPGRWTNHILLGSVEEIDGELIGWVEEACVFALKK